MRDKLLELEKEGAWVFHGSSLELDELEPRQPYTYDTEQGKMVEDGKPSVAASSFADVAIFMALITKQNAPENFHSKFYYENGVMHFIVNLGILEQVRNGGGVGYVHVFSKEAFKPHSAIEVRAYDPVKPTKTFRVGFDDLSPGIETQEFPKS